jgi:GNAT superfamily N-acetyltransferase
MTTYYEWERDGFCISTERDQLDTDLIHMYLSESSYWARGVPREVVVRSIAGALCFGVYRQRQQVGFGRIITDYATFAYLSDVFVLDEYKGRGLGKWLVECMLAHPDVQGLRRWLLMTEDAHGLYQQYGFQPLRRPEQAMEIHNPDIYRQF